MPNYRELWHTMSKLDARFLHVHTRVKACSEAIAFFDGGLREKVVIGLGRIVALYCRSSTSYQICEYIRYLYF